MQVLNGCHDYYDNVELHTRWYHELYRDLGMQNPVTLIFRDYQPVADGIYLGGWCEPNAVGHYFVYVWLRDEMKPDALKWMVAHEMRHAKQGQEGMEWDDPEPQSYEEYCAIHDTLREEADADQWATRYTGFDGVDWWDEVMREDES